MIRQKQAVPRSPANRGQGGNLLLLPRFYHTAPNKATRAADSFAMSVAPRLIHVTASPTQRNAPERLRDAPGMTYSHVLHPLHQRQETGHPADTSTHSDTTTARLQATGRHLLAPTFTWKHRRQHPHASTESAAGELLDGIKISTSPTQRNDPGRPRDAPGTSCRPYCIRSINDGPGRPADTSTHSGATTARLQATDRQQPPASTGSVTDKPPDAIKISTSPTQRAAPGGYGMRLPSSEPSC